MASVTLTPSPFERLRTRLDRYLESEIERGSFPGAVYAVGNSSGLVVANALGFAAIKPAKILTATETIYDVASLTKPLITTTLVLQAHADGLLDVDRPVSEYLPEFKGTDKERVTFVDLLSHRAGFEAWYPLYSHGEGPDRYLEALVQRPLLYEPGTKEIYSDLGMITAHLALMRVLGRAVDEVARERILEPLGLQRSF